MTRAIDPRKILVLVVVAVLLGVLRQVLPNGLAWKGNWPDNNTSAEEAYKQMSQAGDPPYISLADTITHHRAKDAVFLDARKAEDFQNGRIPGARNLPYYQLEKFAQASLVGVNADTPLIIYCEGVGCELSLFLGRELISSGYSNVRIFYGGYPEWKNAGMEIEK